MNRSINWRRIAEIFAFLWLVSIVVGYYVTHKPFSPQIALSLALAFVRTLVAMGLVSIAGGVGRRLLHTLDFHPLISLALQAALGMGVLGVSVLVVGALGFIRPIAGWGAYLLLGIILRKDIIKWWRYWKGLSPILREAGWVGRSIAVGVFLILSFTLVTALAPPWKYDALVYHLALPQIYLAAERFIYVPEIMYWGMPQLGEMLYTWTMALAGAQAAVVVGWAIGVLALVGVLGYVSARLDATAAWVSVAALLSGFSLASLLSWGYVEWLQLFYGLAFLVALDLWMQTNQRQTALLAGIFAGMALGVKYTAGILLPCGLVVILCQTWRKSSLTRLLADWFQFALVVGLTASPWLMKNWLATGNPIYPFLFPSGAMDPTRLEFIQGGLPWGNWQDVAFLPFRATFLGIEGAPGYSASIGPIFLALGPLAFLSWSAQIKERRQTITLAALISITGILIWMVVGRFSGFLLQSRLYLVMFPALAVLAGAGFSSLSKSTLPGIRLGRIASFLVIFVLALNVFEIGVQTVRQRAFPALLGEITSETYLDENLGWFAPTMRSIQKLPSQARVLMLWEPRSFYCWPKCEPDEILDRWLHDRYARDELSPQSPQEILSSWKQMGYTHVLLYKLGVDFIRANITQNSNYQQVDWLALQELLGQLSVIEDFGQTYILYKLDP
jgi:hypothetical protein